MVLAVSLAGASLYPAVNTGCAVQLGDAASTGDISIEQAGVTENGSFQTVLNSQTDQEILVESLQLQGPTDSLEVVQPETLAPGADLVYEVGQVERTGSCQDYTINVDFDKGPLKDQQVSLDLRGSLNLVESFASLIRITGDSVSQIDVLASIHPSEDTLCIGSDCTESEGTEVEGDEYVNYSGDEMTGTLRTSDVDSTCLGNECPVTSGDRSGYVSTEDAELTGTLNVTEIMPLDVEDPSLDLR
jgi:hypothetical protein